MRDQLQPEKKIQSSVCWVRSSDDYDQFFCCGGKFLLRPEKKRYSRLSGGCAMIITTGKKRYSHLSLVAIVLFVLVQLELNLI